MQLISFVYKVHMVRLNSIHLYLLIFVCSDASVGMDGTDISLPGSLHFELRTTDDFICFYCERSIPHSVASSFTF